MTYRKTQKSKRSKRNLGMPDYQLETIPEHKQAYLPTGKRDGVNPEEGKYNGYEEGTFSSPSLKKTIRQKSKKVIQDALQEYEDELIRECTGER